jgi:hypothetical protein
MGGCRTQVFTTKLGHRFVITTPNITLIQQDTLGYDSHVHHRLTLSWALARFWRTLVMIDHFWDFDRLVEDRVPGEVEIVGSWPLFREILGLWFM